MILSACRFISAKNANDKRLDKFIRFRQPMNCSTGKMKRRTVIICGIVALVFLSPWILGGLWLASVSIYGKFDLWRYQPTSNFRSEDWKRPNLKYRYSVLDYVAASVVSTGMTETETEGLLGKPDRISEMNEWQYETKRPGWYVIDFSGGGLLIEFNTERKVSRLSENLWVD